MRYIDTSIVVAYLTPEKHSNAEMALMRSVGAPLGISAWTEAELWSALGIKLRTRQLSISQVSKIVESYTLELLPRFFLVPVRNSHHRRAKVLLDDWKTSLRAGDSLHLAIAESHRATLYTLDVGMAKAGTHLGLPVALLQA